MILDMRAEHETMDKLDRDVSELVRIFDDTAHD